MKPIRIQERLSPYSHTLCAQCLLPGTALVVDLQFPKLFIGEVEIALPSTAGFFKVTLQQDLERNCVFVFSSHFRMKIKAEPGFFETLLSMKGMEPERKQYPLKDAVHIQKISEKLSLGMQKAQDWDLVLRRFDLKEILPFLYSLAQKTSAFVNDPVSRDLDVLKTHLRSAFQSMLVPQKSMDLQSIFQEVRSWFFQEQENRQIFFSFCPFPTGRMTNIQSNVGLIDLEWRKHIPRRMVIHSQKDASISLEFPQKIESFRFRCHPNEKGARHFVKDPFLLEAGKQYLLDCFYKDASMI